MPTSFILPKPNNWQTFEDLVCDLFSCIYHINNFQRYGLDQFQRFGRSGQSQNGVDIVGNTEEGLVGIQCKHHPNGNIKIKEVKEEIEKSERFSPKLNEYIIATSADRDSNAHKHILKINEQRIKTGKYPVKIIFWDDICKKISQNPSLLYEHFTQYFLASELKTVNIAGLGTIGRKTTIWPADSEAVFENIHYTLGEINKVSPYNAHIGITTFKHSSFEGIVDIEVGFADLFSEAGSAEQNFLKANKRLNEIKSLLENSFFSKEITFHLQARLSLAFLVGWKFRKVSGFNVRVVSGSNIYASYGLPFVMPGLIDRPPKLVNQKGEEIILILNLSRDVNRMVNMYIEEMNPQPKWVISTSLEGNIKNAAHAFSLATTLSKKVKNLHDVWGATKIHLFAALPAALALLIGHQLNAVCPIHLYFMHHRENTYKLAGVLTNNT